MTNFNRFLTLFLVAFLAINVWGAEVTYTFSDHYASNTVIEGDAITLTTGITATFTKRSGGTNTQYYTSGSAVRWYGGGTLVISGGTNTITAITLDFGGTKANAITADVGTYTDGAANGSGTWSGSATTITFTQAGTSNHDRISAISVTYSGGGSTITVSYNANGGTGSMSDQTGSTSYTVKTNGFTAPSGGTFTGWNTAADGSGTAYAAGATISTSATLYAQWKYKVRFYTASGTYTDITETTAHAGVTPPSMEETCGDYTFLGWSTTQRSTDVTTATSCVELTAGKYYPSNGTTVLYPIYTKIVSGGGSGTTDDVLTSSVTGVTTSSYTDISGISASSSARYAGNVAGSSSYIQLRSNNSNSGIVTTTSGGNVSSIAVVFNSALTTTRSINVYGKTSAYTDATDLYSTSTQGTLIGTITYTHGSGNYNGSITGISGYTHIGFRSSDGAIYLSSVTITWSTGTPHYYSYPTCVTCTTPTLDFASAAITKYVGDANFTAAFTGTNPGDGDITYTSSNTTCADVNSSTGEVTIKRSTESGAPVTITAYLAAAGSDPCYKAKVMTYTIDIKNRINWIANEVTTTAGDPTVATNYNGTITAIPTNPAAPTACSSKSFVGWTTIADWDSDEAPEPLYPDLASFSSLKVRENLKFYAVFAATTTGDPVSTLTQTLQYDTWTYTGTTTDKDSYRLFGDGAYIYSAAFDLSKLSQVVVCGGTFGGDSYSDISIRSASGTEWATESFTSTNAKKEYTITSSTSLSGTQALRIYSESGNGTTTGVRISKVEIYEMVATTVGTAYVTKCCTDWDDPTLTYDKYSIEVGDADATKTLSGTTHGTLSFSSSNTSIATVNPSTGAVHAVSPGNVTITANWTKDGSWCAKAMPINFTITGDVTITFDANGGTGSMASQVVSYATTTSLNSMSGLTAPDGKTFIGWNTQANSKGTAYANGASVKLTTNTTLYAQWGTSYTITLHRNGVTQAITVLSTDFPYTLPKGESDYCDAWQFDGWSASAVADNSNSYTKVTQATTAEDADFYAVYRGAPYAAEAYVRINEASDIEANKQYIFVAYLSGQKHVMTNTFTTANYSYGEMTTIELAESGKDYFLKSVIDTDHPQCRWKITGSSGAWGIFNMSYSSYCINLYYASDASWYTTSTTSNTFKIIPNYLYWTIESNASVTYKYFNASKQGSEPNVRYVFQTSKNHSGALQIYKLGETTAYHYTSTPSGEGCAQACTDCGAQFTYPAMDKSISSKPFSNPVVYSGTPNNASKAYSSSDESVATVDPVTGEVTIEGIGETTITMTQLRDNTDPSHPVCGITISYDITVTSPSLEVVEVTGDDRIIVEHDFDGITKAEVDSSKLDIKGTIADDIFISKYYEAASEMKLIGLYNGTEHDIDLSQLRVRTPGGTKGSVWGGSSHHGEIYLERIVKLGEDYPDFLLPPFQEIVFWSNNESGDNNGGNAQLCYCVNMTIGGKNYNYEDMIAGKVPNWYRIGSVSGGEDTEGNKALNFNGDDAIILERSTDNWTTWTAIDLFGAGTPEAPVNTDDSKGAANGMVQQKSFNDTPGGWYWNATSAAGKELSTNRFYLTRLSTVKSGLDAVEKNATSFATLEDEWTGEGIGGGTTMEDYCGSGELFSEVATYDYAKYYTDYVEYKDKFTASDNGDGTFTLQFNSGELEKLSCKKIKISVQDALDNTKTAEVEYRVPIIVTSGSSTTTDELFNKHDKDECKVCDVAILDGAVLTKSKPATPAQVAADREQMYNIDVYGGGELYIPAGTTYNINTLTVRSKGDAVGVVDVQGTLKRNNTTLFHSKRFHNAGADWRWYYFSLPYDCDVSTVTYSNGDPAVHGVDFEIDWYDGESRASSQANGNWRSIASHPDYPNMIKAGYGYTIAVEEKAGHTNVSLLFPMANFTEATQINVPVGNWGAGDDGVTVNHKGWNVVGNPFLTRYKAQEDLDVNGELRTGMLVYEGGGWTQTDNGVNYATVPINGGQSGYTQEALTNRNFDPFMSFIIQVGGDAERNDLAVQLKNTYKNKRSSIVQRKESEYEVDEKTPVWLRLNLSNANGETDQTTVLISDNYSTEYDMQRDLAKWRGTSYKYYTRPVLASVYGGHELAFDALPDSIVADRVPLTYYSRNAGTMAFELSNSYNWQALDEVILYDAQSNTQHNLLTKGKYEFQSAAGEVGNRFSISAKVNRRNEPAITTGIILPEMQNVRLAVINRNIMLNGLTEGTQVYVFDMSGRLVGRQTAKTPYISFTVPAIGVYNIRLVGKNAGTTLRALVQH